MSEWFMIRSVLLYVTDKVYDYVDLIKNELIITVEKWSQGYQRKRRLRYCNPLRLAHCIVSSDVLLMSEWPYVDSTSVALQISTIIAFGNNELVYQLSILFILSLLPYIYTEFATIAIRGNSIGTVPML